MGPVLLAPNCTQKVVKKCKAEMCQRIQSETLHQELVHVFEWDQLSNLRYMFFFMGDWHTNSLLGVFCIGGVKYVYRICALKFYLCVSYSILFYILFLEERRETMEWYSEYCLCVRDSGWCGNAMV